MDWDEILGAIFFGILKLIYFIFPVAFLAGGIALGCVLGMGVKDSKVAAWASDERNRYTRG